MIASLLVRKPSPPLTGAIVLFLILLSAFLSGAAGCLVTIVCSVVSMVRNRRRGEADDATVARVIDYKVGWVPLRFECHLLGGGSYVTSSVPGYVNPVVALLGVVGVACIVSSAVIAERAAPRPDAEPGRAP